MPVHWIRDANTNVHPRRIVTHCGIEAWASNAADEFDTALCNRIEAADLDKTTCKRCLRSYDRITTTRRRDRSRTALYR